ncbi:Kinesin-like protein KIF24 [Nosema granulosis]|uniref:Kinesin-like protein KIF24 n=1 Tax=Nosema granulosis TaxID=83296 RepID=A0A9P6GY77_9MICR|nr:Kinesin-like protein KIF24 [Nosema granulosis]
MEELKDILKRNGVYHLYSTLKDNGISNLEIFSQLSKRDIEILDIDEYIDKLRLNKILDEVQRAEPAEEQCFSDQKILVFVRKRPPLQKEDDAVDITKRDVVVNEHKFKLNLEPYTERHTFNFDMAHDQIQNNKMVYSKGVKEIVNHVVRGGSGSIIAYGQTGSGKTYTMMEEETGMVILALKDLIEIKRKGQIVFCEIYLGQVYDLLNNRSKIVLREVNGVVHLTNIKPMKFETFNDVSKIIKDGLKNRKTGVTGANVKSSRSHAVIIVNFGQTKSDTFGDSNSIVFVDLAGSERGTDRQGSHNDIKNEGAEINKSLLALKECIRGIEKELKHLPFRQSKLTQILKNSFVGTSKTCIIATISPSYDNVEHTLNTLRYASRIKETQKGEHVKEKKAISGKFIRDMGDINSSPLKQDLLNLSSSSTPTRFSFLHSSHSFTEKFIDFKEKALKTLSNLKEEIESADREKAKDIYERLSEVLKDIKNKE